MKNGKRRGQKKQKRKGAYDKRYTKNPKPSPIGTGFGLSLSGAGNRNRTCTPRELDSKSSASASSAIPAFFLDTFFIIYKLVLNVKKNL